MGFELENYIILFSYGPTGSRGRTTDYFVAADVDDACRQWRYLYGEDPSARIEQIWKECPATWDSVPLPED